MKDEIRNMKVGVQTVTEPVKVPFVLDDLRPSTSSGNEGHLRGTFYF
jgi:hypothetical protein